MKTSLRVATIALFTSAFSAPLEAEEIPLLPVTGGIHWVYDYEEGKKISKKSGKPMFVVFRCER